ncbi:cytochrome c biogenesis protein CcsA [Oryzomicrobium sp.]|uniref:cytochrome C assembly family protein n=1 Tax=Oryzomicrobium sp. TaxID=1911578 RepID=UPI0025CDD734|nr:cytochrome c biogenesis protein CcsA [Oryzomicrobium sp.]MCE1244654.1 cytochrome c biogenesis protein CcsA [Oryzomicrobium sp.]
MAFQLSAHTLAAVVYALLGAHYWRAYRSRPLGASPLAAPAAAPHWTSWLLPLGLAAQGIGLYAGLYGIPRNGGPMSFSFALALSLMLWLALAVYWLESFRTRLGGQPLLLFIAALGALAPVLFPQAHPLQRAGSTGFELHFLAAMAAYSLFTLAAIHAVFMSLAERQLHRKDLSPALATLPPLMTMENMLFRMIGAGFLLLTAALVTGVLFSESVFGRPLTFDHKTVFAIASWVIFAGLLVGRRVRGWRGKVALRWTLAGFLLLLLAYVGSRFVAEVILHRPGM